MNQVALQSPPRYRCAVQGQVPVTLENVTSEQRSVFFFGSPNTLAWGALAVLGMRLYGSKRASAFEGKTFSVPADGEATLTDTSIFLRLMIPPKVSGVSLRSGAERAVNMEIPYRTIRSVSQAGSGVLLDLVRRGPMHLQPKDRGDFKQWLAHLSYSKTWQMPTPVTFQAQVPTVGWCQQDYRFTFGLPQLWLDATPAIKADYARDFVPSLLLAFVGFNAGQWEPQVAVCDNGSLAATGLQASIESLAAQVAESTSVSLLGPIQSTALDGDPMVLVRCLCPTPSGMVDRWVASIAHRGNSYALWYNIADGRAGDGSYERWWPDLQTMIATWHWYA